MMGRHSTPVFLAPSLEHTQVLKQKPMHSHFRGPVTEVTYFSRYQTMENLSYLLELPVET